MKKHVLLLFIAISLFVACGKKTTTPSTTTTPPAQVITDSFDYYMNKLTGKVRLVFSANRKRIVVLDSFNSSITLSDDTIFNSHIGTSTDTISKIYNRKSRYELDFEPISFQKYFTTNDTILNDGHIDLISYNPLSFFTQIGPMDSFDVYSAGITQEWKSNHTIIKYFYLKDSIVVMGGSLQYNFYLLPNQPPAGYTYQAGSSIYKLTN